MEELEKAIQNVLVLADEKSLGTIALPSIGSGMYVFSNFNCSLFFEMSLADN